MSISTPGSQAVGATNSNATSHPIPLPDGIQVGERVSVKVCFDGNPTITWPDGWNEVFNQLTASSVARVGAIYREIDGTEGFDGTGDTITVTTSVTEQRASEARRIAGHDPATPPAVGGGTTGTTASADPGSLNPAGWAIEETLWEAVLGYDNNGLRTITGYPSGYTSGVNPNGTDAGSGSVGLGVAYLLSEQEVADPDAFTLNSGEQWRAFVIAHRPSSGATFDRAAAVAATALVASAGTFWTVFSRAAAVAATGEVATVGQVTHVHQRSAALAASSQVATTGQRDLLRQAALAASAAVQSASLRALVRQVALAATGSVAASGFQLHSRVASITADAGIATTGGRDLLRSVGLAATGSVQSSGQIEGQATTHQRSASVSATAGVATVGEFWSIFQRSTSLGASGAIDVAGHGDLSRRAAFSAAAAVSATGEHDLIRTAVFAASGSVSAVGQRDLHRVVIITATGGIASGGGVPIDRWLPDTDTRWSVNSQARWPSDADDRWAVTVGSRWPMDPEQNW